MEGGRDLSLYAPLDHEGNVEGGHGCHRGLHQHLNVVGAQAGFVYYYPRRTVDGIRRASSQGWKVVGPDDPERQMDAVDPNLQQAGLTADGSQGNTEIVLCKMHESQYRRFREATDVETNLDPAREWEQKGRAIESRYPKHTHPGRTYFAGPGHGLDR